MKKSHRELWSAIRIFVRGDTPTMDFETWVYTHSELEDILIPDLFLEVISTDYSDPAKVNEVKSLLSAAMPLLPNKSCQCEGLGNLTDVGLGEHERILSTFLELVRHEGNMWWLSISQCSVCQEYWLIASESRINDVLFLKRTPEIIAIAAVRDGIWPNDFSSYADLLRLGLERGHKFEYIDPLNSSELFWTIVDLAKAHPNISITELTELLPIPVKITAVLSGRAVAEKGVQINLSH